METAAISCGDLHTEKVGKLLIKEWFHKFVTPTKIFSDQGLVFETRIFLNYANYMEG